MFDLTRPVNLHPILNAAALCWLLASASANADISAPSRTGSVPRVVAPTAPSPQTQRRQVAPHPSGQTPVQKYPWRTHITATVFWIGELPTPRNPTPNTKSSWDTKWAENFGGYDDPNPDHRIANFTSGEFRPKNFIPKLSPFYIALPYNDVQDYRTHKPEAARVIPWFTRMRPAPGKTVLKGRWVQLFQNGRSCFAQWEDCGPWTTDDWQYVFGNQRPKATQNNGAGIDISPAVRDFLGLRSGDPVHWRFVEESSVPYGPWRKYGGQAPAAVGTLTAAERAENADARYREYLEKNRVSNPSSR